MAADFPERNTTRVCLSLPELAHHVVTSALASGIRAAIGDLDAEIDWYPADEDYVILVKQKHASWWAMMPAGFAEMIGGYVGTSTMRWRQGAPPEPNDE